MGCAASSPIRDGGGVLLATAGDNTDSKQSSLADPKSSSSQFLGSSGNQIDGAQVVHPGDPRGANARIRQTRSPDGGGAASGVGYAPGTSPGAGRAGPGVAAGVSNSKRAIPLVERADSAEAVEEEESVGGSEGGFYWTSDLKVEDDYDLGRLLGKGQFGSVFEAVHKVSGDRVAVKRIDKLKTKRMYIDGEIGAMRMCRRHPYVVTLYCVYESPSYVYLVMELMEGGELFERLVSLGAYSETDAREPIRCVTKALAYMHSKNIVHRDLKPENLLLTNRFEAPAPLSHETIPENHSSGQLSFQPPPRAKPGTNEVKLADFGLSKIIDPGKGKVTTVCGTWAYSAPEMRGAGRPGYGTPVDCWALGILIFIILSGYHPFDPRGEADQATILAAIQSAVVSFEDPVWTCVSDSAKDLISKLLVADPSKRLTAAQAIAHPWMRSAYLSQEPLNPHIAENLDRYRKKMAAKMRASMIVAMASVVMLQVGTGRRWSAPSVPQAAKAVALVTQGDGRELPEVPQDRSRIPTLSQAVVFNSTATPQQKGNNSINNSKKGLAQPLPGVAEAAPAVAAGSPVVPATLPGEYPDQAYEDGCGGPHLQLTATMMGNQFASGASIVSNDAGVIRVESALNYDSALPSPYAGTGNNHSDPRLQYAQGRSNVNSGSLSSSRDLLARAAATQILLLGRGARSKQAHNNSTASIHMMLGKASFRRHSIDTPQNVTVLSSGHGSAYQLTPMQQPASPLAGHGGHGSNSSDHRPRHLLVSAASQAEAAGATANGGGGGDHGLLLPGQPIDQHDTGHVAAQAVRRRRSSATAAAAAAAGNGNAEVDELAVNHALAAQLALMQANRAIAKGPGHTGDTVSMTSPNAGGGDATNGNSQQASSTATTQFRRESLTVRRIGTDEMQAPSQPAQAPSSSAATAAAASTIRSRQSDREVQQQVSQHRAGLAHLHAAIGYDGGGVEAAPSSKGGQPPQPTQQQQQQQQQSPPKQQQPVLVQRASQPLAASLSPSHSTAQDPTKSLLLAASAALLAQVEQVTAATSSNTKSSNTLGSAGTVSGGHGTSVPKRMPYSGIEDGDD